MADRTYFNRKVSQAVVAEKVVYMISRCAVTKRCGLLTRKQSVLATATYSKIHSCTAKQLSCLLVSSRTKLVSNFIKQYPSIYSYFVNKVK